MSTHSATAASAMTRWPAEDSIVRPKDQILFTGISLPTAYRLARQNCFPKPRKVGLRASGWLRWELEAFARGEWQPPAAGE